MPDPGVSLVPPPTAVPPPSIQYKLEEAKLPQSKKIKWRMLNDNEKAAIIRRIIKHSVEVGVEAACQLEGAATPWYYNWKKRLKHLLDQPETTPMPPPPPPLPTPDH